MYQYIQFLCSKIACFFDWSMWSILGKYSVTWVNTSEICPFFFFFLISEFRNIRILSLRKAALQKRILKWVVSHNIRAKYFFATCMSWTLFLVDQFSNPDSNPVPPNWCSWSECWLYFKYEIISFQVSPHLPCKATLSTLCNSRWFHCSLHTELIQNAIKWHTKPKDAF